MVSWFRKMKDGFADLVARRVDEKLDEKLHLIQIEMSRLWPIIRDQTYNLNQHSSRIEKLIEFRTALESAGITRKFGSRIDVDFDVFLDSLGPSGEHEVMRVILDRKKNGRRNHVRYADAPSSEETELQ